MVKGKATRGNFKIVKIFPNEYFGSITKGREQQRTDKYKIELAIKHITIKIRNKTKLKESSIIT